MESPEMRFLNDEFREDWLSEKSLDAYYPREGSRI